MLQPGGVKIWRPRQLYVGSGKREYQPIEGRKEGEVKLGDEPTEVSVSRQRRSTVAEVLPLFRLGGARLQQAEQASATAKQIVM